MIRHLFTLIWNERKANGLILVEYILVFTVLWFCCDFLYHMGRFYLEPTGFDIENTYQLKMQSIDREFYQQNYKEEVNEYELAMTVVDRIRQHPEVESVTLAIAATPYTPEMTGRGYMVNEDSVYIGAWTRQVMDSYFEVYRITPETGSIFEWPATIKGRPVLISPKRGGLFAQEDRAYDPSGIYSVKHGVDRESIPVTGTLPSLKLAFYENYENNVFVPLNPDEINLWGNQISFRTKPGVGKDFPDRFLKEMEVALSVGPYMPAEVISINDIPAKRATAEGYTNMLKNTYAITAFLLINIFLGIIGTFWNQTQARQSEIGLRIALGATPRNVKQMIIAETMILLFIASLIAVNISINLAQTDFMEVLELPMIDRTEVGTGHIQDLINYMVTFLFLAIISIGAIWYPARKASEVPPAEVLKCE